VNMAHPACGIIVSSSWAATDSIYCARQTLRPLYDMLQCTRCVVLQWSDAAVDCTSALAIDAGYVKAYMRRASAYEQSDDLERALADYQKVRSSRRYV
jgi:hypothetical protein